MYLRLQIRSLGGDTLYSQGTEALRTAQTISEPLIFMFKVSPVFQMTQLEAVRPDHISTGVTGSVTLVTVLSPLLYSYSPHLHSFQSGDRDVYRLPRVRPSGTSPSRLCSGQGWQRGHTWALWLLLPASSQSPYSPRQVSILFSLSENSSAQLKMALE